MSASYEWSRAVWDAQKDDDGAHIDTRCKPPNYGRGCDGWDDDDNWCECGCHTDSAPDFRTDAQVAWWHGEPGVTL